MSSHHKIISTDCYIRHEGKVLMLKRNKKESLSNKQFYRGIGGKAEQGENPFDCVVREVKEEAGIDIEPFWKGIVTISRPSGLDWECHIFTAEGFSGNLIESPEGELTWISESDIQFLELPEGDKKIYPLLFKKDMFHAHLKYDDNKNLLDFKIHSL